MRELIYLTLVLLIVNLSSQDGGGSSDRGRWKVIDKNSGIPCIIFWGQIDLTLTYYEKDTDAEKDGHITVPGQSTVISDGDPCNFMNVVNGRTVASQLLSLQLYHMPGWRLDLYFTTDKAFMTNGNEWALYQAVVTANYSSAPSQFPNPTDLSHVYTSPVFFNGTNELADYVYADLSSSLYCPSHQKYMINDNPKVGPRAAMEFSLLQVQAFMKTLAPGSVPFGYKETCPTDQHVTDKIPIIVGSVLAGLIIFVMIAYLIYRACLPDEVIHLVNPASHENKAMSIDDEDEEEEHHRSENGDHF